MADYPPNVTDTLLNEETPRCTFCAYFSYTQRQVLAAILVVISFLGVVGNVLVIAAVLLSRKLRRVTNCFVFSLSVADLLTSLFLPFSAVAILNEHTWPLPTVLCSLTAFVFLTCLGCSINSLACIAVNRYVLITKKRETYRRLYSSRRTTLAILIVWMIPLCTTGIPAITGFIQLGFEPKYSSCTWVLAESSPRYVFVLFAIFCPIQLTTIILHYMKVFLHIRKHTKAVGQTLNVPSGRLTISESVSNSGLTNNRNNHDYVAPERKKRNKLNIQVTKNLFVVVCAFVLCVLPYTLTLLLPNSRQVFPFAATILMMNSCINPIIYAIKHPQFKTVFRCIVTRRFRDIS
ncbi:5-hydroxytryptamine receptor-like [Patiria miniata]|uniref:G-protein coupled receptors family 1 profile domain-containing protein n=1 Tax=Patiria miniata TaxID=46514 RepID=A0A914AIY5_PATMI|nr:5-hydroxytryptamine receptor-like [Patiria miniata]